MLKKISSAVAAAFVALALLGAPASAADALGRPHPSAQDKATKGFTAPKAAPPAVKFDRTGKVVESGPVARSLTTCPGTPAKCYSYVGGIQNVTNDGAGGNHEATCPFVKNTDYHSLSEVAVIRDDGAGVRQIVELGTRKTNSGSCQLFVFSWKNNIPNCYDGCGWVDYAPNTTWNAGSAVTAGQQMSLRWVYDSLSSAWWAWVDPDASGPTAGDWIGSFPLSVWSGLSTPFTTANQVQWYFEVASTVVESCTDMGNGNQGSGGAAASPRPAFIASASYHTAGAFANASLGYYVIPSGSAQWTQNTPSVRTFYGGGPGWNSAGTAVGSVGSC
jgi:hypothetical protein